MVLIYFGYGDHKGPIVFLIIKIDESRQEKRSQSMSNLSTDIFLKSFFGGKDIIFVISLSGKA